MLEFEVVPLNPGLRRLAGGFIRQQWGSDVVVARGQRYWPAALDGFAALRSDQIYQDDQQPLVHDEMIGLVTYQLQGERCEIVTIDSIFPRQGVGRRLLLAVRETARQAGCQEIRLITTNDNLDALRFYQRNGFRLAGINRGAVDLARQMKPEIPLVGLYGIPIHDELELVFDITTAEA